MSADNMDLQGNPFAQTGNDPATRMGQQWNEATVELNRHLREDDKNRDITQDTISKSTQTVDTTQDLTGLVSLPLNILPPPVTGVIGVAGAIKGISGTDKSGSTVNLSTYQQVMGAVLDTMVDAAQKAAEASEKANKKAQLDQIRKHAELLAHEVKEDVRRQEMGLPPGFFNILVMAPLVLILGGLTGAMASGKIDPLDAGQLGINALQNQVTASLHMIPSDMRAELGYLGAWMAGAAAFQASVMTTVGNADRPEGQQLTKAFARNYGERILTMVQDKGFDGYLDAVVYARAPGEGAVTAEQAQQYKAALKLGLLTSAFALIYKADHNGMSGREVLGRIQNQRLEDAGGAAPLLDEIRKQLALLPSNQRDELIRQLIAFLDSKPPTEALMDPVKVFQGMYKGELLNEQQVIHKAA